MHVPPLARSTHTYVANGEDISVSTTGDGQKGDLSSS